MVTAFITEISRNEETIASVLFDVSKEPGDVVKPVNGNNCRRMEEEKASFIPDVESRGLKKDKVILSFEESIVCRWKGSKRIEYLNVGYGLTTGSSTERLC
jgi:hypothetical protein